MGLAGKVAIVTGGATGIGGAVSRLLANEGAIVWIVSHLPEEEMQPFCDELRVAGGQAITARCDVSDRKAVLALAERVKQTSGELHVLVNCAGVIHRTPAFATDYEHVERMFAVNALGAISMIDACLALIRDSGGGSIVSIASAAAILGVETTAAYSASKAALVHFTRTLAPELRRTGIKINCVAPGSVRTPMLGFTGDASLSPAQEASVARRAAGSASPYGEGMMEPDDIAQAVLFLASDASRAFHGACLLADQGITAAMPPAGG